MLLRWYSQEKAFLVQQNCSFLNLMLCLLIFFLLPILSHRSPLKTYGIVHLLTLDNLEKVNLLHGKISPMFNMLRKTLRLTVDNVDEVVGCHQHAISIPNVEAQKKYIRFVHSAPSENPAPFPPFKKKGKKRNEKDSLLLIHYAITKCPILSRFNSKQLVSCSF